MDEEPRNAGPGVRITISFGRSSSKHYGSAVSLAERFASYQLVGTGSSQSHHISQEVSFRDFESWSTLDRLNAIIGSWRNTRASVEDEDFPTLPALLREHSLVRSCEDRRRSSRQGDDYCLGRQSNGRSTTFGCRLLTGVWNYDIFSEEGRWSYGAHEAGRHWLHLASIADDDKTASIDHQLVLSELKGNQRRSMCTGCPAFSWSRVETQVDALPARIDLTVETRLVVQPADPIRGTPRRVVSRPHEPSLALSMQSMFGGNAAQPTTPAVRCVPSVKYSEIAGQTEAIAAIRDAIELPLKHAEYFERLGIPRKRGIILHGPPGNGKTLLAKAAATESNAHLEIISGPELLSKWVGQTEENLRGVFDRASVLAPSIVLIDELDSVAGDRELAVQQHEVTPISQLLVLLDGLSERGQVVVIGTTNRLNAIDPAITRPGRFDRHILVGPPDEAGREQILRLNLGAPTTLTSEQFKGAARLLGHLSGAEVTAVATAAKLIALKRCLATGIQPDAASVEGSDLMTAVSSNCATNQALTK